jgi:hypothetical protein
VLQKDYEGALNMICHKCKVEMVRGQALENSLVIHSDFPGDRVRCFNPGETIPDDPSLRGRTCSKSGPAVLVACWKCPSCGHSVR